MKQKQSAFFVRCCYQNVLQIDILLPEKHKIIHLLSVSLKTLNFTDPVLL